MKTLKPLSVVLDTTTITYDPDVIYRISSSDIFIPHAVMRELDGLKHGTNLAAENAREFSRDLDVLSGYQDMSQGISNCVGNRIFLIAEFDHINALKSENDNEVVGAAKYLSRQGRQVLLLTNNANMRLIARSMGIRSDTFPEGMDNPSPSSVFTVSREVLEATEPCVTYIKASRLDSDVESGDEQEIELF